MTLRSPSRLLIPRLRRQANAAPLAVLLLALALPVPVLADDELSDAAREAQFAQAVEAYDGGDFESAFKLWLPLAQHGDLAAQRNVAHLLRLGRGVEKDMPRALAFYERSAEMGFVTAQVNLAFMYLNGEGTDADAEEAAEWFGRAARAGHPLAQYNLGVLYETGNGVDQSLPMAMGWYAAAAQLGHEAALERLADLVVKVPGPGREDADSVDRAPDASPDAAQAADTPQDENATADLKGSVASLQPDLETPRQPGSPPATEKQAARFKDGLAAYEAGRFKAALKAFDALSYEGMADAQYQLGRMRNRGEGDPRDPVAALAWWRIAADAGHERAKRAADALESELGPIRRGTAEREAAQFRALIADYQAAQTSR